MSSISTAFFLVLTALTASVAAQQGAWAQCGGIGWTGSTTCISGYYCSKANDYYSQCVPGAASATTKMPTTTSTASGPISTGVKYWWSFGDSYTGTAFDITGVKPSTGNQLGNPGYPGYTACGLVPNWVDLVTVKYNPGTLLTYNLAYGGATIDANLVKPYTATVQSLTDQVNTFLANKGVAPWTASNTLFSIWIGINDLSSSWFESGDRGAFSDTLLNAYFALVQKLYDAGGRDFLFVNVPPIDRAPILAGQTYAQTTLKTVIDQFNIKLAAKVSSFGSSHTGVKTWIYDSNAKLNTLLNSPSTYGFQDGTSYGNGTNLMWCNDGHVSSGVHSYFGQDVATLLKGSFTRRSN